MINRNHDIKLVAIGLRVYRHKMVEDEIHLMDGWNGRKQDELGTT